MGMISEARCVAGMGACYENRGRLVYWWWWFCIVIGDVWSRILHNTVCKQYGHDLEDNGYAGPDSGAIDMYCHRCGGSWHTQLY